LATDADRRRRRRLAPGYRGAAQRHAGEAAAAGATFVDTYAGSVGHDVCQLPGRKWVEGIVVTAPAAPVHPNARGMANTAQQVLAAL